ncbi:MAG: hypothetical protein WA941_14495 [Nitrososphaeraceae archaeon]
MSPTVLEIKQAGGKKISDFFCGFNMHETERLPGTEKVEGEAEAIIKAERMQ